METNRSVKTAINQWVQLLDDERTEPLDFNDLKQTLDAAAAEVGIVTHLQSELQLLADDYRRRIAGMIKAIVAVDRRKDRCEQADDLIQSLTDCSAQTLIDCYRQVQARFKDYFPASFGLIDQPVRARRRADSYDHVK